MTANPYYPVTTHSDTSNLADDEWGLNLPSVQYAGKKTASGRVKSALGSVASLPRCTLIIFGAVTCLILLCIVIAVAATGGRTPKHPTGYEPKRPQTDQGMNFYPIPEDNTILISFKTHKFRNDEAIKKSMDDVLQPYEHLDQADDEKFVTCNSTFHPANATCRLPKSLFGHECVRQNDYGYEQKVPCVLLQLDLPTGFTIRQIDESSPLWSQAKDVAVVTDNTGDPGVIPVSCSGTTQEDKDALSHSDRLFPSVNQVRYFPATQTIPSYFYRERDPDAEFVKPAIMVQFTSLLSVHVTHVTCTAWGQLVEDGRLVHHDLLDTSFAFYIEE